MLIDTRMIPGFWQSLELLGNSFSLHGDVRETMVLKSTSATSTDDPIPVHSGPQILFSYSAPGTVNSKNKTTYPELCSAKVYGLDLVISGLGSIAYGGDQTKS